MIRSNGTASGVLSVVSSRGPSTPDMDVDAMTTTWNQLLVAGVLGPMHHIPLS